MKLTKVSEQIEYKKGGNYGAITYLPQQDKPFLAVTAVKSNWYKTQRGAENFMKKEGYINV